MRSLKRDAFLENDPFFQNKKNGRNILHYWLFENKNVVSSNRTLRLILVTQRCRKK